MDLERSSSLHARARAFVAAFERGEDTPDFDALACDLARYQADHAPGYARLCHARGLDPAALSRAEDIPAVPTDAFKLTRVATFDEASTAVTFRTSGTTIGARGAHAMRDPSTYEVAALAFGRRWLARDLDRPVPVVVLGPAPDAAPDSSLGHMCASFVRAFGEPAPAVETWLLDDDILDLSAFDARVATALAKAQPMLVLATSFALVHLLDAVGEATFVLPDRSRVMQTGGFKGKSREVPAEQLRAELSRVFAIDERAIVAEYGMTELSSQFYEQTLFDPASAHGVYAEPPWARVVPVDPESLAPVPEGETGIAKIVDLMNVDSAVAILTQDRVRRLPGRGGFELLGRAPGAPPRGCSIAIDELLGRT
ncbi:MAG: acyl-protein synthetase [Labilithrix sp.]|nr:acyl-protein synthetase [Labilithrix sp.]